MPLKECTENGRPGYKWGDSGKCYTYTPGDDEGRREAKRRAYVQGYAIEGDVINKEIDDELAREESSQPGIIDLLSQLIAEEERIIDLYERSYNNFVETEKSTRDMFRRIFHDKVRHHKILSDTLKSIREKAADTSDVHVDRPIGAAQKFESDDSGGQTLSISKSLYVPIKKVDEYQHKVYGVVLSPNEVDLQGDMVPPEEIEKASDRYMEKYQTISLQHERPIEDAVIVQNYIAPVDFMLGSELVRQGSWVMVIKIYDPEIWQDVIEGRITGLSIGGIGRSTSI